MFKSIFQLFTALVLYLIVSFLGIFIVPIALLFRYRGSSIREAEGARLPYIFQWWDDPLNTMWGDKYWRLSRNFKKYFTMYKWYLRNPATGLGCTVLGVWGEYIKECNYKNGFYTAKTKGGRIIKMFYIDTGWVKIKLGPDLTNFNKPRVYFITFAVSIHFGQ